VTARGTISTTGRGQFHAKRDVNTKLLDDLHAAAKAYIEGNGGDAWIIGPVRIEIRKPTQFEVVLECVGRGPSIKIGKEESS
jgi:hypothetical protein